MQLSDIVVQNLEFQLLICKICRCAVQAGSTVESHFRRVHKLKGDIIRDIRNSYGHQSLRTPDNADIPRDGSRPVAELETKHGFSCTKCRYLTISRSNIMTHWREAGHDNQAAQFNSVCLQSWKAGRYAKYWIVREAGNGAQIEPRRINGNNESTVMRETTGGEPTRSQLQIILEKSRVEMEAEDAERLRIGARVEGINHNSAWAKDMKWVSHFRDRDLATIAEATGWLGSKSEQIREVPRRSRHDQGLGENEQASRDNLLLIRIGESFTREIDRCRCRIGCVPKETLVKLQGISADSSMGLPFGQSGTESSIHKYNIIGQRYLCFCLRAYQLGREEAMARLAVRFTDEQWSLMGDVMREVEDETLDTAAASTSRVEDSGYFIRNDGNVADSEVKSDHNGGANSDDNDEGSFGDTSATRRLDRAVFLFMIASIKVRVGGNMYDNALLCFCAAIGIRRYPISFHGATVYTGILAGIHWLARIFFLEHVFENEPRELEEVSLEALNRFQKEFAQWMCEGTHTAASKIINWMAYGRGYRQKIEGQPSVRWAEDMKTLFHNGEAVRIRDFKRAACLMVAEADDLLNELLGGQWGVMVPSMDMTRISDDMAHKGAGQSFATNQANLWLEPGPNKAVLAARSQLWDERNCRWKRAGMERWLRRLRMFREALLVLVHIWGGQPGRGPEVMTLRHCDSWQIPRNIFVYDGELMMVLDGVKNKTTRGVGRKVARFLPDHLGRIMVAYIVWLLPAERVLLKHAKMPGPDPAHLEFVWRHGGSKHWETDRLSAIMARKMQAGVGVRLPVGRYRMVAIAIGREIRGIVERKAEQATGEVDDEEEDIEVDPLTGEVTDTSGCRNIIWDVQSGHSTLIPRQHYAAQNGFIGRLQPDMIASYRGVSRLWHQFLEQDGDNINSSMGNATTGKRKRTAEDTGGVDRARRQEDIQDRGGCFEGDAGWKQGSAAARDEEMVQGLRRLLGSTATWKSIKQRESMQTILRLKREEAAICVLPPGAGKSILFMLPAVLAEGGTTVVIVPFAALINDLVERARSFGVDVIQFDAAANVQRETMPRAARLVVVNAEVVLSKMLLAYLDGLRSSGLLRRIFIDECHTLISDAGYRPKLAALASIQRYECPVILLLATLPVVFEGWFRREMLAQSAVIIRDRTAKPNCRYTVEKVDSNSGTVEARVVKLVKELSVKMLSGQKGVVYCRSKNQSEALAEEIGCPLDHGDMTDRTREAARTDWTSGNGHQWIVTLVTLGTGIDIAGITAIIHAGQPYGLVDFIQQTGRVGRREGEVVDSIVVHDGRLPYQRVGANFIDKTNQAQMDMYVSSGQCRRSVISAFMDGTANETCDGITGAIRCDICATAVPTGQRDSFVGEDGRGRWKQFNKEQGQRIIVMQRWLEEVAGVCPVCHVRNHERMLAPGKTWKEKYRCEKGKRCFETMLRTEYKAISQKMKFAAYTCCYRCKLPLDWCQESQEEVEGEKRCANMDKILPVVLLAPCNKRIRRMVQEKFELWNRSNLEGFYTWLTEKRRFHNTNGANIHALWEEIIWKVYKKGEYWFR